MLENLSRIHFKTADVSLTLNMASVGLRDRLGPENDPKLPNMPRSQRVNIKLYILPNLNISFFIELTEVTCPALRHLRFGTIEPINCITGLPVVSGTWCRFKCNLKNGYQNVGPETATCTKNGTWSANTSRISCKGQYQLAFDID
jgi:hypothetical protein